jgi:gamma-glutamyltranspeptidase/glutathione hydrolase
MLFLLSLFSAPQLTLGDSCCASLPFNGPPTLNNCGGSRITGAPFATRSPVLSQRGQVASAHPLASQAGLDILKAGGSAVDAAIATNAVLGVLEPMMNGLGGDLMAIVHSSSGEIAGYNGAGRSSSTFSYADMAAALKSQGLEYIPFLGPHSVTVPGAPRGWCDLHARYGKLPFAQVLEPAMYYALNGAPVPQVIAAEWNRIEGGSPDLTSGGRFPGAGEGWNATFGSPIPTEGTLFKNPALYTTLSLLAAGGCDAYYLTGPIPAALLHLATTAGLHLTAQDLAGHVGEWVTPINTTFAGATVFELPPNPQGAAALEMLNILELYNFTAADFNTEAYLHAHVEAKKLAFADASAYFADPEFAAVPLEGIISKAYARAQWARITPTAAKTDAPGSPGGGEQRQRQRRQQQQQQPLESFYGGDTTYLTTADAEGNMVSLIQSLYTGFGSGLVAPTLGFALQCRGALFSMTPGHPNVYAPGKRPFHTIMPGMATLGGGGGSGGVWAFGVMGGFMQPQGHTQVLFNLLVHGMNVQEAGDAARYYHSGSTQPTGQVMVDGGVVQLEAGVCNGTAVGLQSRGHTVVRGANTGGYQSILRLPVKGGSGWYYAGGSEMRKDGLVAGY